MPARRPSPSADIEELLELLGGILDDPILENALSRAAALLASLAHAESCAIFFLDSGRISHEAWYPKGNRIAPAIRTELEGRARSAIAGAKSASGQTPQVIGEPSLATLVVPGTGAHFVVVTLSGPELVPLARGASGVRLLVRLARILGRHTERCDREGRAREYADRQERWFKRLDEQVRVLDRERQKFAAMVSQTESCVFVTDPDGTIQWANPALAAVPCPGGTRESWLGKHCRDVCSSWDGGCDASASGNCAVARSLASAETVHQELHSRVEGSTRTLYLTALPIKGPDGSPHEVMVTAQDLSELNVLQRSETRYRRLFERNANALLMIDPLTQRVLLANTVAGRLLDSRPEDLVGLTLAELHDPEGWTRLEQSYAQALREENSAVFEAALRLRDGREGLVEVRATRLELEGQAVAVVELRDITESRRVERALRQTEERLRAVVASSPVVLFALDHEAIFTLSEGRGLNALGLSPGEVVGRSVFEVYPDVPEIHELVRRTLAGEEVTGIVDVGGLAYESRYAPLRDADGRISGLIGVATDVTERRRLEDQLRHSQKMEAVGQLAGGVAHDFNNLLTTILGGCELLLMRLGSEDPLRRYAEEIQKGGIRGSLLTRQLLAFGRRELLAPRSLDLREVVSEMDYMLKRLVDENVRFVTRLAPGRAMVWADQGQVEQVLMNLVVNARDAMPEGGQLTVEVDHAELDATYCQSHFGLEPGSYVRLAVSDTGCGIAPEDLARIYEPFFTTKERGRGTGLGLSTVYGIVTRWSGHIAVYSEPGRGSSFKVYLPCALDERDGQSAPSGLEGTPHGTETILLVEDEETVRGIAREILELHGYDVIEAVDGAEALRAAADHPGVIHLVLTDVVMPNLSGGQLVERLLPTRPGTKVLYMSGYPDDAVVRNGLLDASADFVQKPFLVEGLVRRIREVLDAPAGCKALAAPPRAA